jgi:hypothetical protein
LQGLQVDFLFFAFRWNVMFLIREFADTNLVLYLFDVYLLEDGGQGFASLHVYICCACLLRFRTALLAMTDTTDTLLFLQALPTQEWTLRDVKDMIAEAFALRRRDSRVHALVAERLARSVATRRTLIFE